MEQVTINDLNLMNSLNSSYSKWEENSLSLRFFDGCQTSKKEVFSKRFNSF